VRYTLHHSYENLLEVAETCAMCAMLLAAIFRSNNQFDHEEFTFYSTDRITQNRDNLDGTFIPKGPSGVFDLSIKLSNANVTCDKVIVSAAFALGGNARRITQNELLVFAPSLTQVHLGYVEDPGGVQLKSIASDLRLEEEQKFALMKDWVGNKNVVQSLSPLLNTTTNRRSKRKRVSLSPPFTKARRE